VSMIRNPRVLQNAETFLTKLSDYQFLKKDSISWGLLPSHTDTNIEAIRC
jgi:hypothetical protein